MNVVKLGCVGLGVGLMLGLTGCGDSQSQVAADSSSTAVSAPQPQKELTPEEKCLATMREIRQLMLSCGMEEHDTIPEGVISSLAEGAMSQDEKAEMISQVQAVNMEVLREYTKVLKLVNDEDHGEHLSSYDIREKVMPIVEGECPSLVEIIKLHNEIASYIPQAKKLNELVKEVGGSPVDVGEQSVKMLNADAKNRQKMINEMQKCIDWIMDYKKKNNK